MKDDKDNLLTAGNIAKKLGVTDLKVKKALKDLGIVPKAKKGVCNYYGGEAVIRVKAALR